MTELDEALRQLGRESARLLAELGVRAEDEAWIRTHAETIASLGGMPKGGLGRWFQRLARRAARTAR